MRNSLSEADLVLIHALQISPRASWTRLAAVLGESTSTLAARWSALRAEGLAWVTAYPSLVHTGSVALVEIDVAGGALDDVCLRLDSDPRVVTIEHAARGRDLVLTVFAHDFIEMSATLLDDLGRIPGVVATRAHLAADTHVEGSDWRLDALDPAQQAALAETGLGSTTRPVPVPATFAPLADVLARDGRATAAEIAAATGRPDSTVRRQLARLLRSGALSFRCEVAQTWTPWPVCATWWCRVPSAALPGLVEMVRAEPRARLCLTMTGPQNILITMWTSSMKDVLAAQGRLETRLGGGVIADNAVVLRIRKRMGWMLHPDGRCTGVVHPPSLGAAPREPQPVGVR